MSETKKGGRRPGAGRPHADIDWKDVEGMCFIQCTREEIYAITGHDEKTFKVNCLRVHGIEFSEYYKQKRENGKKSLRRAQWEKAVKDKNPALLIWMGKQSLGQSDDPAPDEAPPENYQRPETMKK
jgi:hypothetical protein